MNTPDHNLLEIRNLAVEFDSDDGIVHAVSGVDLDIHPGETLGLVGESGCGKSVTAMSIPRLIPQPPGRIVSGRILLDGRDMLTLPIPELRKIRGAEIGVIFQEPMTALSPLHKVGRQLEESILLHRKATATEIRNMSLEWLAKTGIKDPQRCLNSYPFELSGGMRQRVMIAMAMMLRPKLIIADEPTTALDVTIQAQILDLMLELKAENPQSGLLMISHDMGVIAKMCQRFAVMYAGKIVEIGTTREIFENPRHPYTQGLLASIPALQPAGQRLHSIPGTVPSLINPPTGCSFAPRCSLCTDACHRTPPELTNGNDSHRWSCWNRQN